MGKGPTIRQKKLAKIIIENSKLDKPLNAGQMLAKASYSKNLQKQPIRVINSQGVQDALSDEGFTEENARAVVQEIMLDPSVDPTARLKATDQVFKVKGSYAPEKTVNLNVNVNKEAEIKAQEALKKYLNGNTGNTTGGR